MKLTQAEKDARLAARKSKKEAERFPLLAYAGLTRTWTGEEIAARRTQIREHGDAQRANDLIESERAHQRSRETILRLAGPDALSAFEDYMRRSMLEVHGTMWTYFWTRAASNVEKGELTHREYSPFADPKPRKPCDPELVARVLAKAPAGLTHGDVCDALGPDAHILDTVAAVLKLRDTGRVELKSKILWVLKQQGPGCTPGPARSEAQLSPARS